MQMNPPENNPAGAHALTWKMCTGDWVCSSQTISFSQGSEVAPFSAVENSNPLRHFCTESGRCTVHTYQQQPWWMHWNWEEWTKKNVASRNNLPPLILGLLLPLVFFSSSLTFIFFFKFYQHKIMKLKKKSLSFNLFKYFLKCIH